MLAKILKTAHRIICGSFPTTYGSFGTFGKALVIERVGWEIVISVNHNRGVTFSNNGIVPFGLGHLFFPGNERRFYSIGFSRKPSGTTQFSARSKRS